MLDIPLLLRKACVNLSILSIFSGNHSAAALSIVGSVSRVETCLSAGLTLLAQLLTSPPQALLAALGLELQNLHKNPKTVTRCVSATARCL